MLRTNTKSAAEKKTISGNCKTPVMCCPTVYNLSKDACRQHQRSSRRGDQVERIGLCGFRSLVSSVTARLTAGIANRRRILTSSNLQSSSSSKTTNLAKGLPEEIPNVVVEEDPNVSLQRLSPKPAESGKDATSSITCIGKSESEDDGMKRIEDDGCSGSWWWWDTAWYDLTNVTPADISTFSSMFNSWLTTTVLDDDSSRIPKMPNMDSSSSSISTAQHVTSLPGISDEDEVAKESTYNDDGIAGELQDNMNETSLYGYHLTLKMALLRAASRGHRDVVCDILQQTSHPRKVATVDTGLYDLVNCVDSEVGLQLIECCRLKDWL